MAIEFIGSEDLTDEEREEFAAQIEQFLSVNGLNPILNLMRPDAAVLMAYPRDAMIINCHPEDISGYVH